MANPVIRSTTLTQAIASTASNAYSAAALRVQQSAVSSPGAIVGDFRLTGGTWGGTPAAGSSIQLVAVDRTFGGTIGPTPGANFVPRICGTFSPQELSSTWGTMSLNNVPLSPDADYYLYNNATGQTIACTMECSPWYYGT